MILVDKKYISMVASRLLLFKDRGNGTYNFRCPYCGDSLKSKHKCRGNIFENHETHSMWYYCHNCGVSVSFSKFLKDNAFDLYEGHKFDTFAATAGYVAPKEIVVPKTPTFSPTPPYTKILSKMHRLSECPDNLIKAKEYIMGRKIPSKYFNKMYVVEHLGDIAPLIPEFKKFVDEPEKYKSFLDASMICFPHFLPDGSFNFVQMRSYDDNVDKGRRFIKFKLDDSNENLMTLYGIDRINFNNKVIIVEGHIDSLCVTNAIAMGTASSRVIEITNKLKPFGLRNKHDVTLALDNDYRTNEEILKFLNKTIDDDIDAVIYDHEFSQFKDFNDAIVKGGWTITDIDEYIERRTFRGLTAKMELMRQLRDKK